MCLTAAVTKAFLPGILSISEVISVSHSTIGCSNKTDLHHRCSNTGKQPTNHCYLNFFPDMSRVFVDFCSQGVAVALLSLGQLI